MAKYRTHLSFNLLIGYPIGAVIFYIYCSQDHGYFALFSSAFLLSSLFFNPDLDIAHSCKLFSIRGLLTAPFRPYSFLFSHRGISHLPLIGTATRLAYLGALAVCIFICYEQTLPSFGFLHMLYDTYTQPIWIGISGLAYGDICHIILDGKKQSQKT